MDESVIPAEAGIQREPRTSNLELRTLSLLAVLVALAYANSLWNGFAFDDMGLIVENKLLTQWKTLPSLVASDYWVTRRAADGSVHYSSGLYRPLVHLSFAANYALGGVDAFGYHLVNILLHLLVACVLLLLGLELRFPILAAGAAAGLFAVHPLHTEAVTAISGRAELLMALGVVGGWWLALKGRLAWSVGAFAMGLLSKEQAVVLPLLVFISDLYRRQSLTCVLRGKRLRLYGGYLITLILYLFLRGYALEGWGIPPTGGVENPLSLADGSGRLLTAIKIAGMYLWLFVWPAVLSADYSYNSIPLVTSLLDPGFVGAVLAWGSLFAIALWRYRRGDPLTALCVALTVITFLPVSNLPILIGTIMGERLFYLPSAGLCLLAGLAYQGLEAAVRSSTFEVRSSTGEERIRHSREGGNPDGSPINNVGDDDRVDPGLTTPGVTNWAFASRLMPHASRLLLGAICLAFIGRTIVRNQDWVETQRLFERTVETMPQNAKIHAALANELKRNDAHLGEALQHFQTALSLYPEYMKEDPEFAGNFADVLYRLGRKSEAIQVMQRAYQLHPYWGLYLGIAYARMDRLDRAEEVWREAMGQLPGEPEIRIRLSTLLIQQGRFEEGLQVAEEVLQQRPDIFAAVFNRAQALEGLGRLQEASAAYEHLAAWPGVSLEAQQLMQGQVQKLRTRLNGGTSTAPCLPGLAGCGHRLP
jgi:Flp pilus assembly protein TadD